MRTLYILCALFTFIASFQLPSSYYTLLRFIITIGALTVLYNEIQKSFNPTLIGIAFICITILFNPLFPIPFYKNSFWIPINIVVTAQFLIYGFKNSNTP